MNAQTVSPNGAPCRECLGVCGAFMEHPERGVDYSCELQSGHDGRHRDGGISWQDDNDSAGCSECNGTGIDRFDAIGGCRICGDLIYEDEAESGAVNFDRFDSPAHLPCHIELTTGGR